jgi:hypothetical protein
VSGHGQLARTALSSLSAAGTTIAVYVRTTQTGCEMLALNNPCIARMEVLGMRAGDDVLSPAVPAVRRHGSEG